MYPTDKIALDEIKIRRTEGAFSSSSQPRTVKSFPDADAFIKSESKRLDGAGGRFEISIRWMDGTRWSFSFFLSPDGAMRQNASAGISKSVETVAEFLQSLSVRSERPDLAID